MGAAVTLGASFILTERTGPRYLLCNPTYSSQSWDVCLSVSSGASVFISWSVCTPSHKTHAPRTVLMGPIQCVAHIDLMSMLFLHNKINSSKE